MDPASIIGLVDASLDLAIKCASTLKRLNTIASQYKNARLTILSMVQNLDSLQLAWNRISAWSKSYVPDQDAAENGLIERLERFLETGALVMEALDEDVSTYDPDDLSLTDRSRLIWNGQVLQDHQNRLRDQATSMTLLLQAIQLPTIQETNEMLRNARKQFQKSDESAYSIVPSRMSSRLSTSTRQSLSSDDNMSYRRLTCENDLFTARVYKRSYRTPLIKRLFLFKRKVEIESDTATITGPERTFSSKSPDTQEHLIDSDEADHQIISGSNDRGDVPSYDVIRTVGEVSALQPGPSILEIPVPVTEDATLFQNQLDDIPGSLFPDRIGTDADDMDSGALRKLMERDRRYLEKKRNSEGIELYRRLKNVNHQMPRLREDYEQEGKERKMAPFRRVQEEEERKMLPVGSVQQEEEQKMSPVGRVQKEEERKMSLVGRLQEENDWKMSPVHRVQDSLVTAVYREPASAILIDASN